MKILEINNTDIPGKRFNGFDLQKMINSTTRHTAKQIVFDKISNDENVIPIISCGHTNNVRAILSSHRKNSSLQMFYSPWTYKIMGMKEFYQANVVHYHLIHNDILSLASLPDIFLQKPAIWTIHDPWAITGHCIYPRECKKYNRECKKCPHLDYLFPLKDDNAHFLWECKKNVYQKIKDVDIIVASKYMENLIRSSELMKDFENIHYIPFGIDLEKFKACDNKKREKIREKLGFKNDDIVILFRSQDTGVKGLEYIKKALKKIKTNKHVCLLTCNDKGLINDLKNKYKVVEVGWINSDDEMIKLYNACDIFLMPSTAEAFGLMAIEAMSCSKPVIVFDNTSLPEITFAPECGVTAKWCDYDSLAEKIMFLIDNEQERINRGNLGREYAIKNYDINDYNKKMIKLYEDVYRKSKLKKKQGEK